MYTTVSEYKLKTYQQSIKYQSFVYIVYMTKEGTEKKMVHMRLSARLLSEIDKAIDKGMYSNRTEFIQAAIRDKVKSEA